MFAFHRLVTTNKLKIYKFNCIQVNKPKTQQGNLSFSTSLVWGRIWEQSSDQTCSNTFYGWLPSITHNNIRILSTQNQALKITVSDIFFTIFDISIFLFYTSFKQGFHVLKIDVMIWREIVGNCCGSLPIGTILSKTGSVNCSCFAPDPTHWYWVGQGQWFWSSKFLRIVNLKMDEITF